MKPPSTTSEAPAISVRIPQRSPPVQLSAVTIRPPRALRAASRRFASSISGAGNIKPRKQERYPPGNGYRQEEAGKEERGQKGQAAASFSAWVNRLSSVVRLSGPMTRMVLDWASFHTG